MGTDSSTHQRITQAAMAQAVAMCSGHHPHCPMAQMARKEAGPEAKRHVEGFDGVFKSVFGALKLMARKVFIAPSIGVKASLVSGGIWS